MTFDRKSTLEQDAPVPRLHANRAGGFSPSLFERYQRSEKAFVLALTEMYVQGISTRKVTKVVEELCDTSVSKPSSASIPSAASGSQTAAAAPRVHPPAKTARRAKRVRSAAGSSSYDHAMVSRSV